jgi:hypothetical protein
MKQNKYRLLRKGIFYDIVGMSTMFIPIIGPFIDIIWAPYAAIKMNEMYDGNQGKIASIIVFIEEILPISDYIPTFTLMWFYTFVLAPKKESEVKTIELEVIK